MECPLMNTPAVERLETKRLILRPFELDDAEAMYQNWAGDPDVPRFMTWSAHQDVDESRQIISEWINGYKNRSCYVWVITLKPLGVPIGSIGFDAHKPAVCSFGYCIGKPYWGRGLTAEAARALIGFAFDKVGANRVEATHDPENPNSGKVMQKCGMKFEGVLRQAQFIPRYGVRDKVTYSILRNEYEELKNNRK